MKYIWKMLKELLRWLKMTFNFNIHGITPDDVNTGGGNTIIETLSPTNSAGLMCWLDGQCNTRQGNDHSKKYMENLVWNVPITTSQTNCEVFPTNINNNEWEGDFLKLATYAYYPACTAESLTFEIVFSLNNDFNSIVNPFRQDGAGSGNKNIGFYSSITPSNETIVLETAFAGVNGAKNNINTNSIYYYAATIYNKTVAAFLNGETQSSTTETAYNKIDSNNIFSGIGLAPGGADSQRWKGLNLGMLRLWNRVLTDSEIQQNYQEAKKRFNF